MTLSTKEFDGPSEDENISDQHSQGTHSEQEIVSEHVIHA